MVQKMDGRGAIDNNIDPENEPQPKTDPKQALSKIKGSTGKAFRQTFLQPIAQNLAWRAQQFSPKQIGYNMLSATGISRSLLQYKFNLDFAKSEHGQAFSGAFGQNPFNRGEINVPEGGFNTAGGPNEARGESGISRISKTIIDGLKSGFSSMIKELRNIRQTVMALARVGSVTNEEQTKTTSAIDKLAAKFDSTGDEFKFNNAEGSEESHSGPSSPSGGDDPATMAAKELKDKKKGLISWIGKLFSPGVILEELGIVSILGSFSKVGARLKGFTSIFGKALGPIVELTGKFGKFIPVVGEVIMVVATVFDAVKGFITEYKKTGSILQGLKGGAEGIIKGLLEIPKDIILGIKWLAEKITNIFGFKDLSKKIESFKFGDMWDNAVHKGFEMVLAALTPGSETSKKIIADIVQFFKDMLASLSHAGDAVTKEAKKAGHAAAEGARKAAREATKDTNAVVGVASKVLDNTAKAVIGTISDKESHGKYNIMYGGGTFSDYSDHPRIEHLITKGPNKGKYSSAAGRYQFTQRTWDTLSKKLGLKDFSPESQDRAAWELAQEDYKRNTHRSLDADAKNNKIDWAALHKTWTSLPGGIEQTTSMADVKRRFDEHFKQETELAQTKSKTMQQAENVAKPFNPQEARRHPVVQYNTVNNNSPTVVAGNTNGMPTQRPSAGQDRVAMGLDVPRA
jgi:muramidase (phage lysozyme)